MTDPRPRPKRADLENPVEEYLLRSCRENGFLCWKFVSPARGGVPDRLVVTPAGTLFVEVKRPGEKPTRRQRAQHAKLRSRGGEVHVVDDFPVVDALMAHLRRRSAGAPTGGRAVAS